MSLTDITHKRSLTLHVLVAFLLQITGGTAFQFALDLFFGSLFGVADLHECDLDAQELASDVKNA